MKKLLLLLFIGIVGMGFGQDTYVPDDSFELLLETFHGASNGTPNDNYVSTVAVESIQTLGLSPTFIPSGIIADFTGIESFIALQNFSIQNMNMIDVDLSALTIVPSGGLFDFQMIIQNCNLLQSLSMPHGGGIKSNITDCVSLVNINYHSDNILEGSSIIGQCPSLTSYDISMVSSVKLQSQIWLANNGQLQCVNLKNGYCSNWASAGVTGSPLLNCIEVDDPNYCNISEGTTWSSQINGVPIYSTNCNNSCSVGINEANTPSLSIYPNPSSTGLIQLNTSIDNSEINVYSIEGKQIHFTKTNNVIDISDNEKGVYLISIDGIVTRYVYQD